MSAIRRNRRNSRTRILSLAGTCGLICIGVIQVPMLADQTEKLRTRIVEKQELKSGLRQADTAAEIAEQLQVVQSQLELVQSSQFDGSQLPNIQSELLDMAKACGVQIRKVAIQPGTQESWRPKRQEPQQVSPEHAEREGEAEGEAYALHTEQISLNMQGNFEQTSLLIAKIRQKPWMMRLTQVGFSHAPEEAGHLAVEATLAFMRLSKPEKEVEFVDWREGSRSERVQ